MKKLIVCVAFITCMVGNVAAQPRVTVTQVAPPPEPCAPGQPREFVDHVASSEDEVVKIDGLKLPCLELTVHLPKKKVNPEPTPTPAAPDYDPNKDNELLGIMQDAVAGVNNLNDRVDELENRKPVPGPVGPRGPRGQSNWRFHIGPSLSMVTSFEGAPVLGGGVTIGLGSEKIWATYHGTVGSDGSGNQVGMNLHNQLGGLIRCGSEVFACGLVLTDSRFIYGREMEGGKQRTSTRFYGAGPQLQATVQDRFLVNISGAYGITSSETTEEVVKAKGAEITLGLSILLN